VREELKARMWVVGMVSIAGAPGMGVPMSFQATPRMAPSRPVMPSPL